MLSSHKSGVYSRHEYTRGMYSQLRPSRRLSASHLQPQPLPNALAIADSSPAPTGSTLPAAVQDQPAGHHTPTSPSSPQSSDTDTEGPIASIHPQQKREDRPVDRHLGGAATNASRPMSSAAPMLTERINRREREHAHNRALLAKRLRGSNPVGSNSTSSLTELASSSTVAGVGDESPALPSPDQIDTLARAHRRRASESSSYFAATHRAKRPHSEHIVHPPSVSLPVKKRPLSLADFRLSKVLGSGGTATVVRAEPVPGSNAAMVMPVKEIALKAVSKKGLNRRAQHYLAREIAIHRNVQSHPNIASLYEIFEDGSGIYLAMELLRGSDLYSVLKRERRGVSEMVALSIVAQVLDALQYMHSMGCAHRDIKPENLMFAEKPNLTEGRLTPIKLVDFGLACARNPNAPDKDRTSSEKCGTVRYAAPEIVTETSYIPELCDIWSVGVVLYSIIAHRNPYTGKTEKEVIHQIQHIPLSFDGMEWEQVSEDTKNFIRWCLNLKASDRPTAVKALNEVDTILNAHGANNSTGSLQGEEGAWAARPSRRRGSNEPQRPLDLSGFSSHVTREGSSSHGRQEKSVRGEDGTSPPRSCSDDAMDQPANFFDGLVKAWFSGTGSSPDRDGSESSN